MLRMPASVITAVLQFVAGAGGDPAKVRTAAGLRAGDLVDPDRRLNADHLAAIMESAAADLEEPAFGLRAGMGFDLEAFGVLSYAVLNASTVGIGAANLARFFGSVVEGASAQLRREGGEAVLAIAVDGVDRSAIRHLQECGGLVLTRMIGRLTGDASWRPDAVSLAHAAPTNFAGHVDYFGVTPSFCAHHNEIRFDASVLHQEVRDADRSSLPAVDGELHEVLRSDSEEESWISALRVQVASRLCDGHPRLSDVAPDFGLSTRSLQRRLGARGLSYRDLVQDARHSLAMRYLEESETDLTEIAFLLGYADLSAFSRAFHRWTETSPGSVRRSRRVGERSESRQRIAAGPHD